MELADYWHLIRKWGMLVVAGTVLAMMVGYGVTLAQHHTTKLSYEGTATVTINYFQPPTVPYNPNASIQTDAITLSDMVNDPAALAAVANRYHVGAPQIRSVTGTVSPSVPVVTVHAVGTDPRSVETFAAGMAGYLAGLENQKVNGEAQILRDRLKPKVAAAQQALLAAKQHYFLVCGCIGGATRPRVDQATLAALHARLDLLQSNFDNVNGNYQALSDEIGGNGNALPPASAAPGAARKVVPKSSSVIKTVLPAAVLGLVLSIGLAALLDYMRTAPVPVLSNIGWSRRRGATPAVGARSRVPVLGVISPAKLTLDKKQRAESGRLASRELQRHILDGLGVGGVQVADVLTRLSHVGQRTLYITSAGRREAKVQTVLSVSVALARRGQHVILVDADPSGGGLSQFLGFDRSPGLTDFLAYPAMSLDQLYHTLDIGNGVEGERLTFLPLGMHPDALQLRPVRRPAADAVAESGSDGPRASLQVTSAASASTSALEELGQSADVVLINGAPVLESLAALGLATGASGTLLVSRRNQADDALTQAREVLQGIGACLLGVIVNGDRQSLKRFPSLEGTGKTPPTVPVQAESAWRENAG